MSAIKDRLDAIDELDMVRRYYTVMADLATPEKELRTDSDSLACVLAELERRLQTAIDLLQVDDAR